MTAPTPAPAPMPLPMPAAGAVIEALESTLPALNLSTDMTQFGFPNMLPNVATQDARPLMQNGLAVAAEKGFKRIIASPGTYSFQSLAIPPTPGDEDGKCINVANFTGGLVIDLQGSSLVFSVPNACAIYVQGCTNLVLKNFSIDFDPLPFTQVRVQGKVATNGTVTVEALPGFPALTSFPTTNLTYAFAYSAGARNWNTPRYAATVGGDTQLQLVEEGSNPPLDPTNFAASLATIANGDILLVEQRTGLAAVLVNGGTQITLRNIKIYSSYVQAVVGKGLSQSLVDGLLIGPPPVSGRLASTNAGGIVLLQAGPGNQISGNKLVHTQDDAIAVTSLILGTITALQSAVAFVMLSSNVPVTVGTVVNFVDPSSDLVVFTSTVATVTTETGALTTVTVQDPLPSSVGTGTFVVPGAATQRGSGLMITNNRIVQSRFARGMTLWGLTCVSITGNYIHETCMAGIDCLQKLSATDWQCGPNNGYVVSGNVLELTNSQLASITSEQLGALQIHSLNAAGLPVTSMPNTGFTISNNFIAATPRAGIWIQNVSGGSGTNNLLQQTSLVPVVAQPGPFNTPQFQCWFKQPLVILTSQMSPVSVSSTPNPLLSVFPTGRAIGDAVAPGGPATATLAGVTSGTVTSVSLVDSSGALFPSLSMLNGTWPAVSFVVPAEAASGAAVVTIAYGTSTARGGIFVGGG